MSEPPGTAILKVAQPPAEEPRGAPAWQTDDEPTHWNYWCREVMAYTTGFAATVYADAGIVAPGLIRAHERSDGSIALWLEDAPGQSGTQWSVARIGAFARQLGHAQGEWADRVPPLPWLSRDWLGQYLSSRGGWVDEDVDWDHPVAGAWPAPLRARLRPMWNDRFLLLARARATTPRTVCHLDIWPMNLIDSGKDSASAPRDGTPDRIQAAGKDSASAPRDGAPDRTQAAGDDTTLLDWSFTGEGGLGEDPANLIIDSVTDGFIDVARLPEIAETVTEQYIGGLREAGWTGSADSVRAAIRSYGAAKYAWFGAAALSRVIRTGSFGNTNYGQDASAAEALVRIRSILAMLADWAYPG